MEDIYSRTKDLSPELFKQLIGVKRETFDVMLEILGKAYEVRHASGGRPREAQLENKLLITSRYWRHYPTQCLLAFDFATSLFTVSRSITWVEEALQADGRFNLNALKAEKEHSYAVDATKGQIRRSAGLR